MGRPELLVSDGPAHFTIMKMAVMFMRGHGGQSQKRSEREKCSKGIWRNHQREWEQFTEGLASDLLTAV